MDESEANELLNKSRNRLDDIDKQIVDLIVERTDIAKDIATAKVALNKDLLDSKREQIIREKICKLVEDADINQDKVLEIFDILFTLSKDEQKKYLE